MVYVSCVPHTGSFDHQRDHLFIGDGAVFHSARYNCQISGAHVESVIAKFNPEAATYTEEKLVNVVMMMPDKFAFEPGKFDLLAVGGCDCFRAPVFFDLRCPLGDVHFMYHIFARCQKIPGLTAQKGSGSAMVVTSAFIINASASAQETGQIVCC